MLALKDNEYASYYQPYIKEISEVGIVNNLIAIQKESEKLISNLTVQQQLFSYAQGKWSIKELIQHLIDTERIMTYRALHIARKDAIEMPGFDEGVYVKNSRANERVFFDLLEELSSVRKSTINLFKSFSENDLKQIGIANGVTVSVRALGYIIAGHHKHHLSIIKDNYLNS